MTRFFTSTASLLTVLILVTILSCNNDCSTEWKERYENGQPKLVRVYLGQHGRDKGIFEEREYFISGQLSRLSHFVDNKQNGLETIYQDDGTRRCEIMFQDGERNGITHEFYEDGTIGFEGFFYADSGFCGLSKWFYDNGNIKELGHRRNGVHIDSWSKYYPNGAVMYITNLHTTNSDTTYFSDKGDTLTKEEFKIVNPDE